MTDDSSYSTPYAQTYDEAFRVKESTKVLEQYPTRVPVIIEPSDSRMQKLKKRKYLVPRSLHVSALTHIVRKQLELKGSEGLFLFCDRMVLSNSEKIEDVYSKKHALDGFLYIDYRLENAFG